jgi:adhesin HecA-like repeat protein
MTLSGGSLSNSGGQIMATGQLSATFSGAFTSSAPGGDLTLKATEQLENRNVIFSSGRMTLQGQDIVSNQARIYSMGDLNIEGAQAGQSASSLFNYAGRIEAQGDITIAADTVTNRADRKSVV